MSKSTIVGTDTVYAALITRCNANFTELYNMLTGVAASTLLTPTIASFANATHTHANAAGGGTLTAAVLGGTITGTYTLGGTPTITTPTITVESWTDVSSFGSGWAEQISVSYMKDPMGFVHLKGHLTSSGSSEPAFTLPTGYVPEQTIKYLTTSIASDSTAAATYIETSGHVHSAAGELADVYLDGITFKAA